MLLLDRKANTFYQYIFSQLYLTQQTCTLLLNTVFANSGMAQGHNYGRYSSTPALLMAIHMGIVGFVTEKFLKLAGQVIGINGKIIVVNSVNRKDSLVNRS